MQDKEKSHFWVGQVPEDIASEYFVETYDEESNDSPISAFARDQGVTWYDHDFLEYGWGEADSIQELVKGYSYSEQWAEELAYRVATSGLVSVNFFAYINKDQIGLPRSVAGKGYWLRYMGVIEYSL